MRRIDDREVQERVQRLDGRGRVSKAREDNVMPMMPRSMPVPVGRVMRAPETRRARVARAHSDPSSSRSSSEPSSSSRARSRDAVSRVEDLHWVKPRRAHSDPTSDSSSCSSSRNGVDALQAARASSSHQGVEASEGPAIRKPAQNSAYGWPGFYGGRSRLSELLRQARHMSTEEVERLIPKDTTGAPTSVGSLMHQGGRCKPCVKFAARRPGCKRGIRCRYCHFDHPVREPQRDADKEERFEFTCIENASDEEETQRTRCTGETSEEPTIVNI